MAMGPDRWKVITPSEFPWEQEACDYLRANLPDADPYLAWQGFNFITDTGSIYEVDVLILTPVGFFLVEVKSHPGVLAGDAASWTWKHEGRQQTLDNPLLLASGKAKKLAGRLKVQKAFKDIRCPFLEPLIFVSAQGLQIELPEHARTRVCPRDRAATPEREGRPGILAALIDGNIPNVDAARTPRIDRATMGAVSRAMEQAGIRQSEKYLRISDYKLKRLLMEGPGWQDWEGVHVSLADNRRRIRRYTLATAASTEQREMLLRAAKREYQVLDTLSHRGILGVKGYTDNEFGPALIFEHHPKAVRLDHYLSQSAAKLGVDARLSLVRQAAEAMKYAHGKGVYHRALAPQSILVTDPSAATPEIKIFNWQTAAREIASGSGSTNALAKGVTATVHVERLVEDASTAYMAPEAMGDGEGGEHLDVFSLGALAYHVFAERPPAASYVELHEKIRASEGLQISAAMDAAPQALQELIKFATFPEVTSRYGTVDDFLKQLEHVEEELTRPEPEQTVHPLDAKIKDRLEGGLEVRSRIGTGSTSHVLLVDDHGTERVLKIARGPEYNARLTDEVEVLKKIRHQYVVEVYKPVQIHGLSGILMQRAGTQTLAHRLKEEGKLHPDLLQRFGDDLLQTVDWLEQAGIPHRDLKPDNIGVTPVGRGDQLHLVLFDFSLSRTSADNVRAGTPRYMDPFLSLRRPLRWDLAAERWSAAATLYEMATGPATGELLKWGDGKTAPAMLDCEATIDAEKFDAEVREGLLSFFARAFRRDPAKRFDNAQDMLKAWREAFAAGAASGREARGHAELSEAEAAAAIAAATLDTPVVALGLGSRAITALDRLGVNNVRDLLRVPPRRVYRMRGVGHKTRRHLGEALGKLRARFPDVQPDAAAGEAAASTTGIGEPEAVVGSVEQLLKTITGGAPTGKQDLESRAVRAYLNLDRLDTPARGHWPTQTEVATELKVSKARVNQWIDNARRRWLKNKNLTRLRDELLEILHGEGGVMTAAELAGGVLATRGSILEEPQRSRIASAVVRAAVEADRGLAVPRFGMRRRGLLNLVARAYDEDDPAALCDYAVRLGEEADDLARAEPLATPQRAIESLRNVKLPALPPSAVPSPMDDSRLLTLAAGASTSAAVSSRLEIYPRGMTADRALKMGVGASPPSREVTLEQIHDRVHGRYPLAQPLPERPELDRLLKDAGWTLRWDDARGAYVVPTEFFATNTYTSTLPRYATGHASVPAAVTPEVAEARDFDDRLRRSLQTGSFLALSVAPRHVRRAAGDLADRFGLDVRSLDELIIAEMKTQAAARKVDWNVVLKADADGPAGKDWAKLMLLVKAAAAAVEKQILALERPVLLLYPGLVARYEQLQLIDHMREGSGRAGNVPGIWLLVSASDHQTALPTIDNRPVPVLGHGQWAWVPEVWLTNRHRGQVAGAV